MSSLPKWSPEPDQSGVPPDHVEQEDRDATAVLTPPPAGRSSDSPQPSDAPTIVDPSQTAVPVSASDAPTVVDLPNASDAPTAVDVGRRRPQRPPEFHTNQPMLEVGTVLGNRYEILAQLGEGGMGAVYKALDRELNRPVALKVIRPDLAQNPSIIERFKQELLLAREVTHRNVIRIYDLGEADRMKFITMEFVEGEDLRSLLLREKKVAPEQAVEIIQQICRALEAAHGTGIIHRDLKPQNVMRDKTGRILVMDFGLARTLEGSGMTQTGALVGTMDYMSPEQALGKPLDQRSDLYTVGLIFYELLTGEMPFAADSTLASLIKRTQERATPVMDRDHAIPVSVSNIVSKCLERDVNLRYQNIGELLADLDAWQGNRAGVGLTFHANVRPWGRDLNWPLIATIATVILLAVVGWFLRARLFGPSRPAVIAPQMSLGILPFRNASGDPSLDWLGASLADMLSTDVGQSARLRTVSQDRLHQVLSDLHVESNASIEPTTLSRLAEFSNADTLVSGQYARFGRQIRIDATVNDLKHDRRIPLKIEGVDEKDIPGAVDRLAAMIRDDLSLPSDVIKELKASSFQPSSRSAAALRHYSEGLQLLRNGKNMQAVQAFQSATKEDADFALAYSRLAEADAALGYDTQAEQSSRKAVDLSQQLPLAEKYLIEANHAFIMKDNKKAIEAFENLNKTSPDNTEVEYALASLYLGDGEYEKARTQLETLLKADPANLKAIWQMGNLEIQQENFQAALEPLNKGLSLAIQTDNPEQKALILQALSICYRLMNKPDEAIKGIQDSMEISRKLGLKRLLAANLSELATNQIAIGKLDIALTNFNQSLDILREIGMKKEYGDTLIDRGVLYDTRGDLDKALQDYKDALQIERDAADINLQALCLSDIGSVYSQKSDMDNALIYYQQSLELRQKANDPADLAFTLTSLGNVYTAMGDYDKALENHMKALDVSRKANDTADAASTSKSIGQVLSYQGHLGAAVSAMQDSLNAYRSANNKSDDLADSLNGLADTLAQVGRGDESAKFLDEAVKIASDLKNESIRSEILNTQGDAAFYRGDYKAARSAYEQASLAASKAKDRQKALIARLNLARVDIADGRSRSAVGELRAAIQQAESLRLKYYWLRGSVDLAEAMIKSKDYVHARQELDRALNASEKLGTRLETAIIHFQIGNILKQTGDAQGGDAQYRQTATLLDEIKKEQGAEHVLDRADLKLLYKASTQAVAGS